MRLGNESPFITIGYFQSVPCSSLSDNTIGESNISDLKTDIIPAEEEPEEELEDIDCIDQGGCCPASADQGDRDPSALSPRPGSDMAMAQGIPILPHLPKYSICIKKGPSGFLGM